MDIKGFDIAFAGLADGHHVFEYEIDIGLFEHFGYNEFNNASVYAKACLEKQTLAMRFLFHIEGTVGVNCDTSCESFDMPVSSDWGLVVKFGEKYDEDDEDVLTLPYNEHKINVAKYLYEMILLSIPMKKVHPDLHHEGFLSKEILNALNAKTEKKTDPRWDKLKDLLNT